MIVSWKWLADYVTLGNSVEEITEQLTMSGLNLEEILSRDNGETAVDLEVTSNRPDCLGHIGVAREISVLTGEALKIPDPQPSQGKLTTADEVSVEIENQSLCPRYVARVIQGVKIGPSPAWLAERLIAVGVKPVNNIVDITNFVLLESGQPLHAFDLDKLAGQKIVARNAQAGESLKAIDHKDYKLTPQMLVIADAERPVAIAGVMGGADTEIVNQTVNVLIETADFSPLSVRSTARALKLHSDSSYRFERGVDREQIDWASRRCCELILQIAGGELLAEPVVAGVSDNPERPPITLRFSQIERLLGITVDSAEATKILTDLGVQQVQSTNESADFVPPSWRRDLTRECDLIEEVARIYGYDRIPDNVPITLAASAPSLRERINDCVRDFATSVGFSEAMTASIVSSETVNWFRPRGERSLICVDNDKAKHLNTLRQSLIPSLLQCRRDNERQGVPDAELFEIAKVYLQANPAGVEDETEPVTIGIVAGRGFLAMKGLLEEFVLRLGKGLVLTAEPDALPQFAGGRGAKLLINGQPWGWLGELSTDVIDAVGLQSPVTVADVSLALLEQWLDLAPQADELPKFPGIERDLNFVLNEATPWSELETVVRGHAGDLLAEVTCADRFRGKQLGAGKKSYVVRMLLRSPDRTLTADEVEPIQTRVIKAVTKTLDAQLRA